MVSFSHKKDFSSGKAQEKNESKNIHWAISIIYWLLYVTTRYGNISEEKVIKKDERIECCEEKANKRDVKIFWHYKIYYNNFNPQIWQESTPLLPLKRFFSFALFRTHTHHALSCPLFLSFTHIPVDKSSRASHNLFVRKHLYP